MSEAKTLDTKLDILLKSLDFSLLLKKPNVLLFKHLRHVNELKA